MDTPEAVVVPDQTPVETVIMERRTVKQFSAQPVPRKVLARLIEAAVWAPNHRLNEPWRFYVLDGASRAQLGAIAGSITQTKIVSSGGDQATAERKAREAADQWANVPALLFVTIVADQNPETDLENYGAACCAVQNLSLAAHALGLGTSWSSGAVAAAAELKTLVGAQADERMVGLLRIGYPDPASTVPTSRRTSGATLTTWVDSTD